MDGEIGGPTTASGHEKRGRAALDLPSRERERETKGKKGKQTHASVLLIVKTDSEMVETLGDSCIRIGIRMCADHTTP